MDKNDIVVIFFLGLFAITIIWAVVYIYKGEQEIKRKQKLYDGYFKCFAARDRRHYVNKTDEQPKNY